METACKNPNCHSAAGEESHIFSFQVKRSKEEIFRLSASGDRKVSLRELWNTLIQNEMTIKTSINFKTWIEF